MPSNSATKSFGSIGTGRTRKRKRSESSESDIDSELHGHELESAKIIEKKLREIAKEKSLTNSEMRKLLARLVKNDHVLALVTLKAEDEIAKEQVTEEEKPGLLIIDTPSVPKLTRSKARELQRIPGIAMPTMSEDSHLDIATLIKEDLHSDDDDEEYTFQEEDFISDDDPNTTTSDIESNPRTPKNCFGSNDNEESSVKFTDDGCFKVPLAAKKTSQEDLLIATRTRSKLCLEQTTIEDIQSEFVPPDVEQCDPNDIEFTTTDEDWMEFLNDFSKPLTLTNIVDDDDPVNDPEYVAAEKVPVDAEELRDANISKRELAALIAELFEGFADEQITQESVNLETPEMFLNNYNLSLNSSEMGPSNKQMLLESSKFSESTVDFDLPTNAEFMHISTSNQSHICVPDSTISNSFANSAIPTVRSDSSVVPIAQNCIPVNNLTCSQIYVPELPEKIESDLIRIPASEQSDTFHVSESFGSSNLMFQRLPESLNDTAQTSTCSDTLPLKQRLDDRYSIPYDGNYTCEYISIKRHIYSEYVSKFESLRKLVPKPLSISPTMYGFTEEQHQMLQQQLRLHVQMITQTFLQTYCHPNLWKLAPHCKEMLVELHKMSFKNGSINAWNLSDAVNLVHEWERSLSEDTEENRELMRYLHEEIGKTNRNTRQIAHFPPRIMDTILGSTVFIYPQYLPRIPFSSKATKFTCFSPAETFLIAFGLEKHMTKIRESGEKISKKVSPYRVACERLSKDTVFGKSKRRVWDEIKHLQQHDNYNPVKYFFEYGVAPPIDSSLIPFNDYQVVPPCQRFRDLPLAWQKYIQMKDHPRRKSRNSLSRKNVLKQTTESFLKLVRETVDENISPNSLTNFNIGGQSGTRHRERSKKIEKEDQLNALTVNVNYLFEAGAIAPSTPLHTNYTIKVQNENLEDCIDYTQPENHDGDISSIDINFSLNSSHLKEIAEHSTNSPPPRKSCKTKIVRKGIYNNLRTHRHKSSILKKRRLKNIAESTRLKRHYNNLLNTYQKKLAEDSRAYCNAPLINYYYRQFKALELYTNLLVELKLFCQSKMNVTGNNTNSTNKRSRCSMAFGNEDDATVPLKSKKSIRQEENFRQMLLPEPPEDSNRKDAIFAFNFYEKVEQILKSSKRPEDFNEFIAILKTFDPHKDKVSDLYLQLEQLFLPDHPKLAEIFLTFLLPSEAAAVGKFFEHFMINNMTMFINKLNVYFNKQPAQVRKIYNCLNELAEIPNVTIREVETKVLPLLKGNQFLIEWFLQQFPGNRPPERLFSTPEQVNLKEVQNNVGDFVETVTEIMESPSNEVSQGCQIRYINGRIFYGTKITLPAKLSFMASSYHDSPCTESDKIGPCIHGIREFGEKQLSATTAVTVEANSTTAEKSTLEEGPKNGNDTSGEEDFEICDFATLRAHATRLNPTCYGNASSGNLVTSTPNINGRKFANYLGDENKMSPRKNAGSNNSLINLSSGNIGTVGSLSREKRKSPSKKTKSPICSAKTRTNLPPMVVIHEQSPAITCAKKLKTLIEEQQNSAGDMKESINIVARTKDSLKYKKSNSSSHSSSKGDLSGDQHLITSSTYLDSDDDCKLHVVSALADIGQDCNINHTESRLKVENDKHSTSGSDETKVTSTKDSNNDWTRDEDKAILIEMKLGSRDREDLFSRIKNKLPERTLTEIESRYKFLIDFLSKLQGK